MPAFDEVMDEGFARGFAIGRLEVTRKMLIRLGQTRLGKPDAATEAALTSICDVVRLERLADAITIVKSWRELLEIS